MAKKILPFLSGTLKGIIEEVSKKGDVVAKEICRINDLIDETLKIYDFLPESLKNAIKEKVIDNELTGEVSMLSCRIGSNEANLSFLPKDKEPEYTENGNWARRNRQEGKPAKIFQKAIVKEFKQKEWEDFANAFKAEVCECNNFEIVSGEDIRKWYWDEHYYDCRGTLGNSCMRYESAQEFFDVYVDNAKMLITKKHGKLTGRAIVWEVGDRTVLDRIYTCFDYLENCFIDYAKEHKWTIRDNNSLLHTGEEQYWLEPDDDYNSPRHIDMSIKLKNRYEMFPYVDSFRYYNKGNNTLNTCIDDYALDSTDGEWERCSVSCDNCGRTFYGYSEDEIPDELHWSEWSDCYVCDDCSFYCEYLEDSIPNDVPHHEVVNRCDGWTNYDVLPLETIEEHECTTPDEVSHDDDAIVKINGQYYFYSCISNKVIFNSETNEYEIRSDSN